MDRPITLQTHIDPVPEFIVKQVLRYLNMDKNKFFDELKKKIDFCIKGLHLKISIPLPFERLQTLEAVGCKE